jgi:hypothetical protein
MGGDLNIITIEFQHPAVVGVKKYRTVADEERRKDKAKEKEAKQEADKGMNVTEYYKPQGTAKVLFEALGLEYVYVSPINLVTSIPQIEPAKNTLLTNADDLI